MSYTCVSMKRILKYIIRNYSLSITLLLLGVVAVVLIILFNPGEWKVSLVSLSLVVGYLSLLFVVISYQYKEFNDKLHASILIKKQLEVIGIWTSYSKGGHHEWNRAKTETDCSDTWGNPFHYVFKPESKTLNQVVIMSGTFRLGEEIIEAITNLNQEINSFHNSLEEIRKFKYSREPYKNIILYLKIKAKKSKVFIKTLSKLKERIDIGPGEEEVFYTRLVEFYSGLHFDLIGDGFTQRLFLKHKVAYEAILEKEKWLKGEI